MSIFGTKEEVVERLHGLRRYNEWEKTNPVELTPEQALAAISSLYRLMTPEAQQRCDLSRRAHHERCAGATQRLISIESSPTSLPRCGSQRA